MADADLKDVLEADGYLFVRQLPTGEWAGLMRMLYTTGLYVGLDETSWKTRFCYENAPDALIALQAWDGEGFPPGYWVKQKPENIHGPGSKEKFR